MKKSIFRGLVVCLLVFGVISPASFSFDGGSGVFGTIIKVAEAKNKKKKVKLKTHKKNLKYLLKMGVSRSFITSACKGRISTTKRKQILKQWQEQQNSQQSGQQGDENNETDNSTVENYTIDNTYPIILSVTDNKGNTLKSSEHNGYVCYRNCSGASGNTEVREGENFSITIQASDPNGRQLEYLVHLNNSPQPLAYTTSNEFNYTITREDIMSSGENMRLYVYIRSDKGFYRSGGGEWGYDDGLIFDYKVIR